MRVPTLYKETMSGKTGTASTSNEAPTSNGALRAMRLQSSVAALLAHGTLSRTEMAQWTGYSPSSMTSTIRDLMAMGHVREIGQQKSSGGRRRTQLQFDRSSVFLTLVSIEAMHVTVSQIDLAGEVQVQVRRRLDHDAPLDSLTEALVALRAAVQKPSRCIVVSLPGVVSAEGDVTLAPALGAPLSVRLQDALGAAERLPVLVENDVNLLALGELAAGAAKDSPDFVLIYIGDGIGGALVIDGRVHRGATRSAGELGFLPWADRMPSATETVGPLEAEWSITALVRRARALCLDIDERHILTVLDESTLPEARSLLEGAVAAWAYAAVVNACVVNPARIVFAGEADQLQAWAKAELVRSVQEHSPAPLDVQFARLGESAIAHGAITTIVNRPRLILALEDSEAPEPMTVEGREPD